jgi:hypothetical protein
LVISQQMFKSGVLVVVLLVEAVAQVDTQQE